METYRDILCKQIDVLQAYFDAGIESTTSNSTLLPLHVHYCLVWVVESWSYYYSTLLQIDNVF